MTKVKKYYDKSELVFSPLGSQWNFQDLTGLTFKRLKVLGCAGKNNHGQFTWFCECSCTEKKIVRVLASGLKNGDTKSCGCWNMEVLTTSKTHGMSNTSEYRIWSGVRERCLNPKKKRFKNYGGRGITICQHWKSAFINFYNDIGKRPSKEFSLDRRDNNKNYSCGHCEECKEKGWNANCRWATRFEQANNRRNCLLYEYKGKPLTLSQISRLIGVHRNSLSKRIEKGMTINEATIDAVENKGDHPFTKCYKVEYPCGKILNIKSVNEMIRKVKICSKTLKDCKPSHTITSGKNKGVIITRLDYKEAL